MPAEKRRIVHCLIFPLILLILMWLVWIFEISSGIDLAFLGVYPLKLKGLIGIVTSPLIHGDFSHLSANSLPVVILGASIFFFYKEIAFKIFFLIYFLSGIWVWLFARGDSYHIGASGIIYGMAAFLFLSGILRRDTRLMAVSLIVIFAYGGMIWGVFPDFFPEKNISWESHLMGMLSGLILALYFRKSGPQRKKYSWELEEEEEEDFFPESENDQDINDSFDIKYHYKEKDDTE